MNTEYNLEITQEVANHFNLLLNNEEAANSEVTICEIQLMLNMLKTTEQENYVIDHIAPLENMLQMFVDNQWSLSISTKKYLLAAFSYLAENDDLIPDDIPVIGLLDDCIVIDIVAKKIERELINYAQFSHSRSIYAKSKVFTMSDWAKIKKIESISKRRNKRNKALRFSRFN